jgi:LemA protein
MAVPLFIAGGVILLIAIVLVVWPIAIYNNLVTLRNRFKNAYGQIDVQLKRRYDLIPNLVEVAKAYMGHERQTLEAVMAARNVAASANTAAAAQPSDANAIRAVAGAESQLTGALGRLFAVVESYPNLKADGQMTQLSEEISSTENRVAFARQAYNDAVLQYNTARQVFPNVLLANTFNFTEAPLFNIDAGAPEREAVHVKF